MQTIDFEEAKRCPSCGLPGEETGSSPAPIEALRSGRVKAGTTVHIVFCRNDRCKWNNTNWVVQKNPDGRVPVPEREREEKSYPALVNDEEGDRILKTLEKGLQQEQQPGGGEVRR